MSRLLSSEEYLSFRSNIPQKKICVDEDGELSWTLYDAGPRTVRCPLLFLPPVSGRADIFFQQMLALSGLGYRVISVDYPVYWTICEFCTGLCSLLNYLHIDSVHLFGASLGGYLAQKFAEHTLAASRVRSLVLCNSFVDTTAFHLTGTVSSFWVMPFILLKNVIMGNLHRPTTDAAISDSIDFISDTLDSLSQSELASRLTLNCVDGYVVPQKLQHLPTMIIDVNDRCALSESVKEELYKCYPEARRAHLKSGGNFPYLSRADEVTLFLQSGRGLEEPKTSRTYSAASDDEEHAPRKRKCARSAGVAAAAPVVMRTRPPPLPPPSKSSTGGLRAASTSRAPPPTLPNQRYRHPVLRAKQPSLAQHSNVRHLVVLLTSSVFHRRHHQQQHHGRSDLHVFCVEWDVNP